VKKFELKQFIREVVTEIGQQPIVKKFTDGVTITIDTSGRPVEGGWKDLGYSNGWNSNPNAMKLWQQNSKEKWYEIELGGMEHGSYCPSKKLWLKTDRSG
jgi:hypothetical protein